MFELRGQLQSISQKEMNEEDLIKIGLVTGKTKMITSYNKAIEEVLASLGTFMGNTLHNLTREMLQNIPLEENVLRETLQKTYEKIEIVLREFNTENLSDSI